MNFCPVDVLVARETAARQLDLEQEAREEAREEARADAKEKHRQAAADRTALFYEFEIGEQTGIDSFTGVSSASFTVRGAKCSLIRQGPPDGDGVPVFYLDSSLTALDAAQTHDVLMLSLFGLARARVKCSGRVRLIERSVGDDGRTICGDRLGPKGRRLCGSCANLWAERGGREPMGCGTALD